MLSRRLVSAAFLVLASWVAVASAESLVVFKHDQFSPDISAAASECSGIPLATSPGFVAGEAWGQMYVPLPGSYPVKIVGVDVIVAAPPNGGTGQADAQVEIWFDSDPSTPNPEKGAPDFVLSTGDVFNPSTQDFGMPLQGNAAMSFEFDWDDPEGHPPALTSGGFLVMIRFTDAAADLQAEWGTNGCMQNALLGMCGCQQVGTLQDQGTTPSANVMHINGGLGNCQGPASDWNWANKIGVTGDFIIRARAMTQGGCMPSCDGKECGDDGCGGKCGDCADGDVCESGECDSESWVNNCDEKECGSDGCDDVCGECGDDEVCVQGKCKPSGGCEPACDGKECGDDGCDGVCGVCGQGESCQDGVCQTGTGGGLAIAQISPAWGYDDQETQVSIVGTGFAQGANAKIGGTNLSAVSRVSDTLISATVPEGLTAGKYMIVVINPDGGTATLNDAFEVKLRPEDDVSVGKAGSGCAATPTASPFAALLLVLAAGLLAVRARRCRR